MRAVSSSTRLCFVLIAVMLVYPLAAQTGSAIAVQSRIQGPIDESARTVLRGNTHPFALARFDRGVAPASLPMDRMLLVLKRSPQQETALRALIDRQQDKASPDFRRWLTPEEFGARFGPSDADIQSVTGWLTTHGFQVMQVSKGRTVIEFRGTAAQVQQAFHTAIHQYAVKGETHWANASDPQIPSALAPVVSGVWSLHNFLKQPNLVRSNEKFQLIQRPGLPPEATSQSGQHAVGPVDYSVIYNIKPVYNAGNTGAGVRIGVVGRSNINLFDVFDFRNVFSLVGGSASVVNNGPDPGNLGGNEEAEAVLDTTWAGAVAPGADVFFVVSASTDTTDGVDLSELYIIDNNFADIMTESFGLCEAAMGQAEISGLNALAQQAAAQGITYTVAAGDTGAPGCDNLSETTATGPISVNGLASTPFTVAVGGTIFNENNQNSKYWSSTAGLNTALSYIPENVWNEGCVSCQDPNIAATGGGASAFIPKPSWQAGVKGIPADGARDIPDVSLTAAGHDPYLLCIDGSCSSQGALFGIAGTSASTPAFAGVMALVEAQVRGQAGNATLRLGLPNYVLYKLAAAENFAQCNASSTTTLPNSACVFNDVTVGNNAVPGQANFGTSAAKYQSGVGFDLATGLGSVNVANLVSKWSTVTFRASATTLDLNPKTSITHGSSVAVTASVKPASGTGTATGQLSLIAQPNGSGFGFGVESFTLDAGGNVAQNTNALPGGTTYNVTAHYAGDGTFAPSDSTPVAVTVTAETSTTTLTPLTMDDVGRPIPFTSLPYGSFIYLRADVVGASGFGFPSGAVNFSDNGVASVPGNPYTLNSAGNTAPANGIFTFKPGSHSVTAIYSGDPSFKTSTSPAKTFSITKANTSATLDLSPASGVTPNTPVILSVSIDTVSGGDAPSGTVTFFNGSTSLGSAPLNGVPGSVSGGVITPASANAAITTQFAAGQVSLTAQYNGDANYLAATSTATPLTISPDFDLATSTGVTVTAPGKSGTTILTVTGGTGYTGTINFAATSCSGLPFGATCSFNPASITGSGTTTLTINTTAPKTGSLMHPFGWTSGGLLFAGVLLLGTPGRKRRASSLLTIFALAGVLALVGCGGGSSSGGGGGGNTPGTPVGTYSVTVSATAGSVTHTSGFTLTVQ